MSSRKRLISEVEEVIEVLMLYGEEDSKDFGELLMILECLKNCRNKKKSKSTKKPKSDGVRQLLRDFEEDN